MFTQALRTVWLVRIAFAAVKLLLVSMEKEIILRTGLETDFGLEEEKKGVNTEVRKLMAAEETTLASGQ